MHDDASTVTISPASITGSSIRVPSSKSHSIRALLIAAVSDGVSSIRNVLDSADAQSCIAAVRALGAGVTVEGRSETGLDVSVRGSAETFFTSSARIDVGNSGTTLYLLTALAALSRREVCFDGDASIRRRSASRLLDALRTLGARIDEKATSPAGCAPYCVGGPLGAGRSVTVYSPTSQYLSALLLATPLIPGPSAGTSAAKGAADATPTVIDVALLNEHPYVDMTCWWLDQQEIPYRREGYARFIIPPGQRYRPYSMQLPGDYSSATFWFCAAAVTGTAVTVEGLLPDDVQGDRGVLDILKTLGCTVEWTPSKSGGGEVVTVSGSPVRGGTFDLNAMPDALPALAVLACSAPESITLTNVPQARHKETDRIAVMATELTKLGGLVHELPDGLQIEPKVLRGGRVMSHGDHRVAMALAIAALGAEAAVTIEDAEAAAVTYPAFFSHLHSLAPESVSPR